VPVEHTVAAGAGSGAASDFAAQLALSSRHRMAAGAAARCRMRRCRAVVSTDMMGPLHVFEQAVQAIVGL